MISGIEPWIEVSYFSLNPGVFHCPESIIRDFRGSTLDNIEVSFYFKSMGFFTVPSRSYMISGAVPWIIIE